MHFTEYTFKSDNRKSIIFLLYGILFKIKKNNIYIYIYMTTVPFKLSWPTTAQKSNVPRTRKKMSWEAIWLNSSKTENKIAMQPAIELMSL